MKLTKSQSGFSPVHLLLLLVLLGFIGFAGWKVYDARTQKSNWEDVAITRNSLENQTPSAIPDGFVEYKNKELGFKFVYPKAWGEASYDQTGNGYNIFSYDDPNLKSDGPSVVGIDFSESNVMLFSWSGQKVASPKGGTSLTYATGFCHKEDKYYVEYMGIKNYPPDGYGPGDKRCGEGELVSAVRLAENKIYVPDYEENDHGYGQHVTLGIFKVDREEFAGWFAINRDTTNDIMVKNLVESVIEL